MKALSSRRNDSSTAFFSHWWVIQFWPSVRLGDAQFAHVEQVDHGHDRILDLRFDVARGDLGAAFKSVFDGFLQIVHGGFLV